MALPPEPVLPMPVSAPLPQSPISPDPNPARESRETHTPGTGALQEDTLRTALTRLDRQGQLLLDRLAPHKLYRWGGLCVLVFLFVLRIVLLEGFYIIAYVLFIFILNQFILFLQPKDRAALVAKAASTNTEDETPALPTADHDEFRPFVRRLPEFKFWYSTSYATTIALLATFFRVFDVPVFWPVLVFYFILLFVATMRRQWLDMKRLKYVPWDIGAKKVYKSDPKKLSVTRNAPPAANDVIAASGRAAPPVPTMQVPVKKTVD